MAFIISVMTLTLGEAEAASIALKAALGPSSNQFLVGYYDISKFYFSTNDKSICGYASCTYALDNGELQPGFVLVGDLKVSVPIAQGIKSEFYHMRIDLDKTSAVVYNNGTELDILNGTVGIGQFNYQVKNATLLLVDNQSREIIVKAVGGNESAMSGTDTTTNATRSQTVDGTQMQGMSNSPLGKAVANAFGAKLTYNATKHNNDVCFIHGIGMGKAADSYMAKAKQALQHQIDIHNVTQSQIVQAQKGFAKAETFFCK